MNSAGGVLTVESRVSDKISGDIGHPVQYDSSVSNWYINVFSANNDIYSQIAALGTGSLVQQLQDHSLTELLALETFRIRSSSSDTYLMNSKVVVDNH